MSDQSDSSPTGLTERSDLAFAEGQLNAALRGYTALLDANSGDVYAWYRVAATLARLREPDVAKRSLSQVPLALAEQGQLLLALAAIKELQTIDAEAARTLMDDVAALYGAGSKRVDAARKAPPPMRAVRTVELPATLSEADPRVLKVLAEEACDKALEGWEKSRGGSAPLPHSPLLSDLDPRDLGQLLPLLSVQTLAPNKEVIEQGSQGTSLYIVARGVAEVTKDGVHLAYLRSGAFFGEMALLTSSPRAASVVAHGPLTVLELSREALGELAAASPSVATVLADYTRERLLRNLLATSELFKPLDPPRREALVDLFTSQVFPPGEIVLHEGEDAEGGLYVVLSGEVRVSKQEDGDDLTLAHLGPGQVFGEISLIKSRPATATITALSKTVVLCLPRDAFNQHVGSFPEVLAHVFRLAQEREQSNRQLQEREVLAVDDDVLI
jgi:cAMP-dependent protein kinase regulator